MSPPKLKKLKTFASYKSLNCEKRKKEMLRISLDNLNLRDRILGMKSLYNQDQWRDHTRKHFHYLKIHCEYPVLIEDELCMNESELMRHERSVTFQL